MRELSSKLLIQGVFLGTYVFVVIHPGAPAFLSFAAACALLGALCYFERENTDKDAELKKELAEMKERLDALTLAKGLRR